MNLAKDRKQWRTSSEEQEWVKFGVAATLSQQYAADQRSFLESLATLLEGTMGDEAEVERKGGFLSRKTVKAYRGDAGRLQVHSGRSGARPVAGGASANRARDCAEDRANRRGRVGDGSQRAY